MEGRLQVLVLDAYYNEGPFSFCTLILSHAVKLIDAIISGTACCFIRRRKQVMYALRNCPKGCRCGAMQNIVPSARLWKTFAAQDPTHLNRLVLLTNMLRFISTFGQSDTRNSNLMKLFASPCTTLMDHLIRRALTLGKPTPTISQVNACFHSNFRTFFEWKISFNSPGLMSCFQAFTFARRC